MKKILIVGSSLNDGGAERVMTLLANELEKRKNKITVILVRGDGEDAYCLNKNINCIRFKYNTDKKIIRLIKRIYMLRKIICDGKFDAVISFTFDINIATLIGARKAKVAVIVSERNDPRYRWKNKFVKIFEKYIYTMAQHIVFQTDMVRLLYSNKIQKISSVIPNPVNPSLPEPFIGEREKIIVAVGRLEKQKNFSLLLQAFAKFHKIFPEYILKIYGKGSLLENLKREVETLDIKNQVEFPGFTTDIYSKMLNAAMYVSSSDFEGISNTMIEALAMGVPTICTDCPVGGAALLIKNNMNGILVPVGDVEKLYMAMIKVAKDLKFSEKIGKNALHVREEYSVEKIVDLWENILETYCTNK